GSPARLGADLEHVPRPPHPRVRDPEVRRRPHRAECLRASLGGGRAAQGRAPARALPLPARQALAHRGLVPRADPAARPGGELADALRGGLPVQEARPRPLTDGLEPAAAAAQAFELARELFPWPRRLTGGGVRTMLRVEIG